MLKNNAMKDRFLQCFTGKSSVDIKGNARRLKENLKVILIGSNRKW